MKSLIFINGDGCNKDLVEKEIIDTDIIICADGGALHAFKLGICPNYLIGDFDSIDKSVFEYYKENGVKIEMYPAEKDYTDTEICINKALELGCNNIVIVCATGNRIDHTLANIFLIDYIIKNKANSYIIGKNSYTYLLKDSLTIYGNINDIISIIPFKGDAIGLNSQGLKYKLINTDINFGRCIGVSNVMIENKCKLSINSGYALVIKEIRL